MVLHKFQDWSKPEWGVALPPLATPMLLRVSLLLQQHMFHLVKPLACRFHPNAFQCFQTLFQMLLPKKIPTQIAAEVTPGDSLWLSEPTSCLWFATSEDRSSASSTLSYRCHRERLQSLSRHVTWRLPQTLLLLFVISDDRQWLLAYSHAVYRQFSKASVLRKWNFSTASMAVWSLFLGDPGTSGFLAENNISRFCRFGVCGAFSSIHASCADKSFSRMSRGMTAVIHWPRSVREWRLLEDGSSDNNTESLHTTLLKVTK